MSSEIENLSASFGLVAPRVHRLRRLTANLDRKVARLADGLADGAPGGDGAAAFRKAMAEISEE